VNPHPTQLYVTRILFKQTVLFILLCLGAGNFSTRASTPTNFDARTDVFAFSNDTVFAYGTDEKGRLTMHLREKPAEFSHRCFALTRAVMQFHQFARFDPSLPKLKPEEYRSLAKKICRIPVWWPLPEPQRLVVIPGYKNLWDFSKSNEHMLKEELGNWFPTYVRPGNWRMAFPFPRIGQEWAAENLTCAIDHGRLQTVYLARNLYMNHCVVLYDYHRSTGGDLTFDLYDPNYPGQKGALYYHADGRWFDFPKRWFWTGGRVNLMRVYLTPWH